MLSCRGHPGKYCVDVYIHGDRRFVCFYVDKKMLHDYNKNMRLLA